MEHLHFMNLLYELHNRKESGYDLGDTVGLFVKD